MADRLQCGGWGNHQHIRGTPQPMAIMTQRSAPANSRHRILIILAAVWMAISLAIGGWVMPDDGSGPHQAAAAADAAQP